MQALALVLGRVAWWVAGSWIARLVVGLGLTFVSMAGVSAMLEELKTQIVGAIDSQGAQVVAVIGMLNLDRAITIVFSAYAVRLVLAGARKLSVGAVATPGGG
jgi:hypothetical protein